MTKIKTKFGEFLGVINSYGFALYHGFSDLIQGIETLLCATYWFIALIGLFVIDIILCFVGICVDFFIKTIDAFYENRRLKS